LTFEFDEKYNIIDGLYRDLTRFIENLVVAYFLTTPVAPI